MTLLIYTPTGEETPEPFGKTASPTREVMRGPGDARHGTIRSIGNRTGNIGYYKESQQWHLVNDSSSWFGWDTEHPPGPSDLSKQKLLDGHEVELSDGNKWLIPVARQFMSTAEGIRFRSALPRYHDIDGDGNWCYSDVVNDFKALHEYAEKWWDVYFAINIESLRDEEGLDVDADADTVTIEWAAEACFTALSTNYIMTRQLLTKLRLVDTTVESEILHAIIDLPSLDELIKKNEQLGE